MSYGILFTSTSYKYILFLGKIFMFPKSIWLRFMLLTIRFESATFWDFIFIWLLWRSIYPSERTLSASALS
jgi:hypothetical protein